MSSTRQVSIHDLEQSDLEVSEAGLPLLAIDLDGASSDSVARAAQLLDTSGTPQVILVGLCHGEPSAGLAEILGRLTLTLAPGSSPQCVGTPADLGVIRDVVSAAPRAAQTLDGVLRATSRMPVGEALMVESLAYSMLLASREFLEWRTATPRRPVPMSADPVLVAREGGRLTITLNRPGRHNAFSRDLRDALLEALAVAEWDTSIRDVVVSGSGKSFCSGGDLDEFGSATDPGAAHLLRVRQSAGAAVHRLGGRVRFEVHGACIGAGIEVSAFASDVRARPGAYFQLPEVRMGLVPGAGGTVSIPRRIGRWRTAYMALTGTPIEVATAIEWGLVDGHA